MGHIIYHDSMLLEVCSHSYLIAHSNLENIKIVFKHKENTERKLGQLISSSDNIILMSIPSWTIFSLLFLSCPPEGKRQQSEPGKRVRKTRVNSSGWEILCSAAPSKSWDSSATRPSSQTSSPHCSGRGMRSLTPCFLPYDKKINN